ncbi:hypothetical protein GOBAR_DD01972 [Gossypium barbadense]|nr:hypothetical protein GOBAR_DD01972 [Gossypium barbadense]
MKVKLLRILVFNAKWHAVASWTWDAQDETCGICRMAFDGCCSDCKLPGDDCPLIWPSTFNSSNTLPFSKSVSVLIQSVYDLVFRLDS